MEELVVISGKGGTGKTSLVASFASLARSAGPAIVADCDVDAPNLHLLLDPQVREVHPLHASRKAVIDPDLCTRCGICEAYCRFDAIDDGEVDPFSCEGCGLCARVCPVKAIEMEATLSGYWYVSETRLGPLVHGRLEPGEENSGRLVELIRRRARELAGSQPAGLILTDGPPGIGCPVISAISGADRALIVTEPTASGLHDLKRALDLCRHFHVQALVCINRYDVHPEGTEAIEAACREQGTEVIGRVPYDPAVLDALRRGLPVVEAGDGPAAGALRAAWSALNSQG